MPDKLPVAPIIENIINNNIKKKSQFISLAKKIERNNNPKSLYDNISGRKSVICEIKPKSPSKSEFFQNISVKEIAKIYSEEGAGGISVLSEEIGFGGSLLNILVASNEVNIPILGKDFVVSKEQIYAMYKHGADAILLIVGVGNIQELFHYAVDLGLDVLLEIHRKKDIIIAKKLGANLIGINNRNFSTLQISFNRFYNMCPEVKDRLPDSIIIAQSGVTNFSDALKLFSKGADSLLVGTSLMSAPNIRKKTNEIVSACATSK